MAYKFKPFNKFCVVILITMLLLAIPSGQTEAAKVLQFVPTDVYNDDAGRLTLVGQFQNIGSEYITYVKDFVPVIYLDDEMYAADTFAFQVNLQPGYFVEAIMKFGVGYKNFSNWRVTWDAFPIY